MTERCSCVGGEEEAEAESSEVGGSRREADE